MAARAEQTGPALLASPIVVIGSEGSGTNFVGRLLCSHPAVDSTLVEWDGESDFERGVVYHISVPHGRGMSTVWIDPARLNGCRLLIVRRSLLDATYSAYRRFYRDGRAGLALRHQLAALGVLSRIRKTIPAASRAELEYERLGEAEHRAVIFTFAGVEPHPAPDEDFTSQNGRYLDDTTFLGGVTGLLRAGRLGPLSLGRIRSKEFWRRHGLE